MNSADKLFKLIVSITHKIAAIFFKKLRDLLRPKAECSVTLVSRIQFIETPYLNEFLCHYRKLGVNQVILVNSEPKNRTKITQTIAPEFFDLVEIIDNTESLPVNGSQNLALSKVTSEYLLHLDIDEFLCIPVSTLAEFLIMYQDCHSFKFGWVLSPNYKSLYEESIYNIAQNGYMFPSKDVKSMAKTSLISAINEHNFTFKEKVKTHVFRYNKGNAFILHMTSRGIFDITNKIIFSQFNNSKTSYNPEKELRELLYSKKHAQLPTRFLLLAFQSRFQDYVTKPKHGLSPLKYKTDIALLKDITLRSLNELLGEKITENEMKIIIDKVMSEPIPKHLVDQYASGDITFIKAVEPLRQHVGCDEE